MSSLTDYIRWYADLSFYELPFNEVDNLVLSTLVYYRYDLKKSGGKPVSLKRCVTNPQARDAFLSAVCGSRRFGNLMVSEFSEIFSRDTGIQFAAMQFHLIDDLYYIAFRGTDNSLVGWREDFMMSYQQTQSQLSSVSYLEKVISDDRTYIVGGHSKGGNLALYGSCHISDQKRSRIRHIYNNDGPGLCPEVSDVRLVDKVKDRLTVILPQYCIFGQLFDHDVPDIRIVTSSNTGIMQHDIISWGVDHGRLDVVSDFDPESMWINSVADHWIDDVTPEERESLVNSIFDTVESRGARTYDDALKVGVDGAEELLKNVVESDNLKTVAKLPEKALFGDALERLRTGKLHKLIDANQLIEGVLLLAVSILMLIFPAKSFNTIIVVLLGGVVLFQLSYTVKKLYESRWNFVRERTRVYIFVAMATVFVILLVKKQAIFIVGSGIAGGWLLVVAYKSFLAVRQSRERDFAYWKNLIKSILYAVCGVFILLAPVETLKWFVLALGGIMAIDGICTILYSIIQANEKYAKKYNNMKDKVKKKK